MKNLVIVDLGSNSVRMAINAVKDNGSYHEIARFKEDTRLSEGMGTDKRLQEPAINKTIAALKAFRSRYEDLPDLTVKAITTAAVRQAVNREEFLRRVKQEVGLEFQVLSGDEEAYYDYLGVVTRLAVKDAFMLDVGGASMELVDISEGRARHLVSLPWGAVNLSEKFHLHNQVTAVDLFNAQVFLRRQLTAVEWLQDAVRKPLVLLGGAHRSLARMSRRHEQILHIEQIHGYQLTEAPILSLFEDLLSKNLPQRRLVSGLEPDRADIIIGGILPLVLLLQMLESDRVIFSESGVREGVINAFVKP